MPKTLRLALSPKTRFDVFKRDGFVCQYCAAKPPEVLLEVDHIQAVANGGGNDPDNLITACERCNRGKGARPLSVVPQSLADRAHEIAERERQLAGYQEIFEAKRVRLDAEVWRVLAVLHGADVESVPRDDYASVKRFVERLGVHTVEEAAEMALDARARQPLRYLAGICWKIIRQEDGTA